ncbi:hypothetical protein [Lysinibacillus sp. JNUCC 51]|uniref:hypothetical protein n=1 Tax=Lysinibacillus sp. JNUCC-51 TaxID=2792479 RepID=UPI001938B016|nr:hypothetical protein JNUCC51_20560 [Lysinibacillus sp. JNUCC-51]
MVQRIQRPGDRWTAFQHDGLGSVIRADYYDDNWEKYAYDKNGSLIETEKRDIMNEILNLHKTLLEAKFHKNPDNFYVAGSPIIAKNLQQYCRPVNRIRNRRKRKIYME